MDFAEAGLLDDLEGKEREAREKLLASLVDAGFTEEELQTAADEDRLALLPVERVLGGKWSAAEIAEKSGLAPDFLLRLRRLLGLPEADPDDHVFGDEWLESAASTRVFLDAGLGEDAIAEISRVLGEAMARVAATTMAAFADAFLQPGDSEEEVAWRFASLAEQLTPPLGPVLLAAFKGHLQEAVQRGMISRAELAAGHLVGEQEMAVCFVDLVGFTTLGGQLEAEELGSVIGRFGELASDVTTSEVRLVKTIGDAAMLTSREPAPLVEATLSLLDAVEACDLPGARAGIAYGKGLARSGDLYGHAVNVASRVTAIARPGSVLCTEEVHDAAEEEFDWSSTGKHRLKGVGRSVPLFRARRLNVAAENDGSRQPKSGRRRKQASS